MTKQKEQTNHSQQDVEKVANDTNSSSNRLNLGAKPADTNIQTAEEDKEKQEIAKILNEGSEYE